MPWSKRHKRRVVIAGGFDPFHEGHLDHLVKAAKLGDQLIVMVSQDRVLIEKKGYYFEPLWFRLLVVTAVMEHYHIQGNVIPMVDTNTTCEETLELVHPDIFAKGAEYNEGNMPACEIRACEKIGCRIVYGVGARLNNSSKVGRCR